MTHIRSFKIVEKRIKYLNYFERLWTDIQINLCNSNITLQISMLFMNRCCHTHLRYKSYFYLKDQRHLLYLFQPKKEHYCIITETLLTAINFAFFEYIKLCINTLIWHKNMHSKTYSHAVTNYKNVHTFKSLWIIGGFCLCMCCIARDAWKKIWITSLHGRGDPAPFRTEISWPEIRWSTKIRRLVESMIYSRLKHRCPYTLLPKKEKKRDEEIMKRINIFTRY